MKLYRFLPIFLCLLMYCEIYAQAKTEKEPLKYGQIWNSMTDDSRDWYLTGLGIGIAEGNGESLRIMRILKEKGYITYNEGMKEQFVFLRKKGKCLSDNFPEIDVVRDVMTKFYADPTNTYLRHSSVFLVSVAKLRGASPELIEKMLANGRKDEYEGKYSLELRELFYGEVLKVK